MGRRKGLTFSEMTDAEDRKDTILRSCRVLLTELNHMAVSDEEYQRLDHLIRGISNNATEMYKVLDPAFREVQQAIERYHELTERLEDEHGHL